MTEQESAMREAKAAWEEAQGRWAELKRQAAKAKDNLQKLKITYANLHQQVHTPKLRISELLDSRFGTVVTEFDTAVRRGRSPAPSLRNSWDGRLDFGYRPRAAIWGVKSRRPLQAELSHSVMAASNRCDVSDTFY